MTPPRPTALAHQFVREILREGDLAIDATAGNGHDTLVLAARVGESGRVLAIDIQPAAIESARTQLAQNCTDATILNGAAYGPGFSLLEDDQSPVHFATKREVAQFLASRATAFAKSDK